MAKAFCYNNTMSKKYVTSKLKKQRREDAQRNYVGASSRNSNFRQLQHNGSTLSGGISGQRVKLGEKEVLFMTPA